MDLSFTLANLKDGAIEELFQSEWKRLMDNVTDPNTSAEASREVTIRFRCKPNKGRSGADLDVFVSSKLAPPAPVETAVFLRPEGSQMKAVEPKNLSLFENKESN